MKNKHLILIFLGTLLLGLLAKYAPWLKSDLIQIDLMRIEANNLQRISITQPGRPELLLEQGDEGWVASQDDFAIATADSNLAPILAVLSDIRSIRIINTNQRDTLLLLPTQSIHVEVSMKNGRKEVFEIGREVLDNRQPATYIEIDRHDGIYLIDKYLRRVFTRSVDDFRSKTLLRYRSEDLHVLKIFRPGIDTVFFDQSDSSLLWCTSRSKEPISQEQVQKWMLFLQSLNGLPFAAHADEVHALENLVARVELGTPGIEAPIWMNFYDTRANRYVTSKGKNGFVRQNSPALVVQSSQNAFNFFALSDTMLAKKIWAGPIIRQFTE